MFTSAPLAAATALALVLAAASPAPAQDARASSQLSSSGAQTNPAAPACSADARCVGTGTLSFAGGSAPIEVASWSFGASNPTSVGSSGMSAGRATAPRDAASGLATGKRQHQPVTMSKVSVSDLSFTKRTALCGSSSACDSPSSVTVSMAGKGSAGGPRCVSGTHFPTVVLTAGRASAQLSDVTVGDCDDAAGTVSLNFTKIEWK